MTSIQDPGALTIGRLNVSWKRKSIGSGLHVSGLQIILGGQIS